MVRLKIRLDTQSQIREFVEIANTIPEKVYLEDNDNHRVNAKSFLGCLYSIEFEEVFVASECENLSNKFFKFIAD